jgi:hypothetical protein
LPWVVPLTEPAVVPLVVEPGAVPGVDDELPVAPLGEDMVLDPVALPEDVPEAELGDEVSVVVDIVVVCDGVEAVVSGAVVVVPVVAGLVAVVVVLGVVVLVVVLLRSQPAAALASARAAARGMRRFMTSPVQCALKE